MGGKYASSMLAEGWKLYHRDGQTEVSDTRVALVLRTGKEGVRRNPAVEHVVRVQPLLLHLCHLCPDRLHNRVEPVDIPWLKCWAGPNHDSRPGNFLVVVKPVRPAFHTSRGNVRLGVQYYMPTHILFRDVSHGRVRARRV